MTLLQLVFGCEICLFPLQKQWVIWRALSIKLVQAQGAKFLRFSERHTIFMSGSVIVSSLANRVGQHFIIREPGNCLSSSQGKKNMRSAQHDNRLKS